jgi:hypothetical protein
MEFEAKLPANTDFIKIKKSRNEFRTIKKA